jgi:hypothetical protein
VLLGGDDEEKGGKKGGKSDKSGPSYKRKRKVCKRAHFPSDARRQRTAASVS